MVTIGTGPDDPRAWVQAAYLLLGAMHSGQAGPHGKLPPRSQIAATLGVHPETVTRAYRELADKGIIYLVPGLGYFPDLNSRTERRPDPDRRHQ
jgi:DNA-binding GntR family transcriptional regulator